MTTEKAPLPDVAKAFAEQDPLVLLAICVWGESRGEPLPAKLGVACVVRNRVATGRYGHGYAGVILKPYQFSCFTPGDANFPKLLHPLSHGTEETWDACFTAAYTVLNGSQPDVTDGAVFYYSLPLTQPPTHKNGTVAWGSVEHAVTLGGLSFWKELLR